MHHHEHHWRPALTEGRLDFGGDVQSMAAVLEKRGSRDLLNVLLRLAKSPDIDATARHGIFNGIASIGGPTELRTILKNNFTPIRQPSRRLCRPTPRSRWPQCQTCR